MVIIEQLCYFDKGDFVELFGWLPRIHEGNIIISARKFLCE